MPLTSLCSAASVLLCLIAPPTGSPAPAEGRQWPLHPRPAVLAPFDPPAQTYGSGHRGVDLAGSPGQAVRSSARGTVRFTGAIGGKPVVVVDHGEVRTTYEPVVAVLRRGQEVSAGDVVGTLQTVAGHCFPATCLHFGVRREQTYLDPLAWLGTQQVRLLPTGGDASGASPAAPTSSSPAPRGAQQVPLDGWARTLLARSLLARSLPSRSPLGG